jgi:hypothetical protein
VLDGGTVITPGPGNEQVRPVDAGPGGADFSPPDPNRDAGPVEPDPTEPDPDPTEPDPPTPPAPDPVALNITRPERGTRHDEATIEVAGRVTGGAAPTLTIAGQPITLGPGGSFNATVPMAPGMNILVSEVKDTTGRKEDRRAVLRGATADANGKIDDALRAKMSAAGLQKIADLVGNYVSDMDLNGLVPDSEEFTVENITYSRIEVRLTPQNGKVRARLVVHDLHVEVSATFDLIIDVTLTGSADCDQAIIEADLLLSATRAGGLDIAVSNTAVDLQGFEYNINYVPGFIENLFTDWVRGYAEDLLTDTLADFVVPSLFDPSVLTQEVEILGTTLQLGLEIRDVVTNPSGVELKLAGLARAPDAVHPGKAMPSPVAPPQAMGNGSHLDVAMQAGMIGRIVHAAWAGGLLDIEVGPGGAVELPPQVGLPLLRGALGQAVSGFPANAVLTLQTRPLLPATVTIEDGERPIVLHAGDLLLDMRVDNELVATVALDFVAHLALDIIPGQTISLVPDFVVEAHADVADQPRGPVNETVLETLMATFAGALPGLVADQTFSFSTDFLPVPINFTAPDFEAEPEGGWIHVRTNLR